MGSAYCATAVVPAAIVNVMDSWPAVCAVPFSVHFEKVYPDGSVAGACRFTLAPEAMFATKYSVVPPWPVLEVIPIPAGGVDCTSSV